jgi:hypothetical protein
LLIVQLHITVVNEQKEEVIFSEAEVFQHLVVWKVGTEKNE